MIAKTLPRLRDASSKAGVSLPASFLRYAGTPELHARIRSNTDCLLNLSEAPVASPVGNGWLVRFLADSQGCVFWYLYIPAGATEHAVVAGVNCHGPDATAFYGEDGVERELSALVFAAPSFEDFLCRFWIENELWFSEFDGTPMSEMCRQYLECYRTAPVDPQNRTGSGFDAV